MGGTARSSGIFHPENDERLRLAFSLAALLTLLLTILAILYSLAEHSLTQESFEAFGVLIAVGLILGGYSGNLQLGSFKVTTPAGEISASAPGEMHDTPKKT
jgi:hypothetical protein